MRMRQGYASMVNLDYAKQLSEHLGVEKLGLIPLYKGDSAICLVDCHAVYYCSRSISQMLQHLLLSTGS